MAKTDFYNILKSEVTRIDSIKTSKRNEKVIESFSRPVLGKINGKDTLIFNSNDYLGLRHNLQVKSAEHSATDNYGTGPGAVRFISGSMKVHKDLEEEIAKFHGRESAMVLSSAFAANLAVMFCLLSPQAKDSKVDSDAYVISDALNHRSIIDGVRLSNLPTEQKSVFEHMNMDSLDKALLLGKGKYPRAVVVTDGVFSMLGEYQHLDEMRVLVDKYDKEYPLGVLLVVDDCHGVGSTGVTGRGVEELKNSRADILVGTFGKGFGSDGGYIVSDKVIIDYLRESAATYIYSNSITPGTAAAALQAIRIVDSEEGVGLLKKLKANITYFKAKIKDTDFGLAADSEHAIQPILVGDPVKNRGLADYLMTKDILVTPLSYPVVQPGRDEIRVQISAAHETSDIDKLIQAIKEFKI